MPAPSSTVVGVEGEPLQIPMVANANPTTITYAWTKDGQPLPVDRIGSEDASLNISRLMRSDAGIYTCFASNSQGVASINVTVVVECKLCATFGVRLLHTTTYANALATSPTYTHADGASIGSISENTLVSPGDEAVLSCRVDGKPLTEEHVRWERAGYDMSAKTTTKFVNGTSYLHIANAQRADVGNYRCVADNRVANPTSRDVLLIVKCE